MKSWDQKRNPHGGERKKPVPNCLGVDVMFATESLASGLLSITDFMKKIKRFIQIETTMRNSIGRYEKTPSSFFWYVTGIITPLKT